MSIDSAFVCVHWLCKQPSRGFKVLKHFFTALFIPDQDLLNLKIVRTRNQYTDFIYRQK